MGPRQEFEKKLAVDAPEQWQRLQTIPAKNNAHPLGRITRALHYQMHFDALYNNKLPYNQRNELTPVDVEAGYPVVKAFAAEVLRLHELGLKEPSILAIYNDSATYAQILERYRNDDISHSTLATICLNNRRYPLRAVEDYMSRLYKERATRSHKHRAGESEANLQRKARVQKSQTPPHVKEVLLKEYANHEFITPAVIATACVETADAATTIADIVERVEFAQRKYGKSHPILRQSDMVAFAKNHIYNFEETLEAYISNIQWLEEKYKDHPDISRADKRRLARKYIHNVADGVAIYLASLERVRDGSTGKVPDSYIKQALADSKEDVLHEDIEKRYTKNKLRLRYNARAQRKGGEKPANWMLERLVTLYWPDQVELAGEGLYALLQYGFIQPAQAESKHVRLGYVDEYNKVSESKSKRHLTFAPELAELTPAERIALAHHHSVSELLYGRKFNTLQLEMLLGCTDLDAYVTDLDTRCHQLKQQGGASVQTSYLIHDLKWFDERMREYEQALENTPLHVHPQTFEKSLAGLGETVTVVGSNILRLSQLESSPGLDKAAERWVANLIRTTCPPGEQMAVSHNLHRALETGSIQIVGSSAAAYRVELNPSLLIPTVSDIERAAFAHVLGVDRLIYGSDLGRMLRKRLDQEDLTVHVQRTILPKVTLSDTVQLKTMQRAVVPSQAEEATHDRINIKELLSRTQATPFALQVVLQTIPDAHRALSQTEEGIFIQHGFANYVESLCANLPSAVYKTGVVCVPDALHGYGHNQESIDAITKALIQQKKVRVMRNREGNLDLYANTNALSEYRSQE